MNIFISICCSFAVKGVNFFGPHSEFVVSGSDGSNIFFWDKETTKVINYVHGDHGGVVCIIGNKHLQFNCIANVGICCLELAIIFTDTYTNTEWLMPLASQYLLLVLYNVQA